MGFTRKSGKRFDGVWLHDGGGGVVGVGTGGYGYSRHPWTAGGVLDDGFG